MYRMVLDAQREMSLWGFGCVLRHAEQGKLFLSRYSLTPLYCSCPKPLIDVWLPAELRSTFRPERHDDECCTSMLLEIVRWFGEYERWVVETIGVEARRELLGPWTAKIVCQADEMAVWWEELERALESTRDRGGGGPESAARRSGICGPMRAVSRRPSAVSSQQSLQVETCG
jgi:hypothetical protein